MKNIIFLCLATLLLSSCSDDINSELLSDNQVSYTGEELFKGIFFSDGKVAPRLSNFENSLKIKSQFNKVQNIQFEQFQNNLIQNIKKADPAYFYNFKSVMESGNLVSIRSELKNSGEMVKTITEKMISPKKGDILSKIELEKMKDEINLNNIDYLTKELVSLDQITAIKSKANLNQKAEECVGVEVFIVAVAVEIALWIDMYYWVLDDATVNSSSAIYNEQFIESISEL